MIINIEKTKLELAIDITLLKPNSCKNVVCECPECKCEFIRKYRDAKKYSLCGNCSNKKNANTNTALRGEKIKKRWARVGHPRAGTAKIKIRTKPKAHHRNFEEAKDHFYSIIIDKSNCWITSLKLDQYGYSTMGLMGNRIKTHRFSYLIHKGEIPDGQLVRHTCHNRACVNPEHLLVGTIKDNSEDMVKAGRSLSGSKNHASKFTDTDIIHIWELLQKKGVCEIARIYNVQRDTISFIKNKKTWRILTDTLPNL